MAAVPWLLIAFFLRTETGYANDPCPNVIEDFYCCETDPVTGDTGVAYVYYDYDAWFATNGQTGQGQTLVLYEKLESLAETNDLEMYYTGDFTVDYTQEIPTVETGQLDACVDERPETEGMFYTLNSIFCGVSVLFYLILMVKFPLPKKTATVEPTEDPEYEEYLKTGKMTFLSAEKIHEITMEKLAAGEQIQKFPVGKFADDIQHLDRIVEIAGEDFKFFSKQMAAEVALWRQKTEEEKEEKRKVLREFMAQGFVWEPDTEKEFGEWIIKYLQYAGYATPAANVRFWKTIIMTVFPRLVEAPKEELAQGQANVSTDWIEDPTEMYLHMDRWMASFQTLHATNQGYTTLSSNRASEFATSTRIPM